MININDHVRQFVTTYISYTQMYVVMIKHINSPKQSIMTTYFLFNTIQPCDDKHKSKIYVDDSMMTT